MLSIVFLFTLIMINDDIERDIMWLRMRAE